jgi:uncharacterized protein YbjT (DUF2867 family)
MKISPIIYGASGMVGKGVLLECLDSPDVEKVLTISRRPLGITHPKLKEIIAQDVSELEAHKAMLKDYDACFFCLGITSVGLSEEEYTKTTYTLTMKVANQLHSINDQMTFCYVSGAGTDTNGRMMWARVKGRTEDELSAMFKSAYMFRPGVIVPLRGIHSRTKLYNTLLVILKPFFPLLQRMKSATDTTRIGKAMINAALKGYDKHILEVVDINALSAQ